MVVLSPRTRSTASRRRAGLLAGTIAAAVLAATLAISSPVAAGPSAGPATVVQLGDSYSAGFGVLGSRIAAGTGTCTTPGYSVPAVTPGGRLAATTGATLVFAACGGAGIADVAGQFAAVRSRIPGDGTGTVIVFSAGGNDVRSVRGEMWTGLIQRCILLDLSCDRRTQNRAANIDQLAADMESLVETIAASAPGAVIRVMGYPELMQRTPGCWGMTGIDREEADFLDSIARDLNGALAQAVAGAGSATARFIDPVATFDNHGACQTAASGQRFVNDVDFVPWSLTVAANSLHPNAAGYDAYAGLLAASLITPVS
jgi:lysophospholipase L1-like esterase